MARRVLLYFLASFFTAFIPASLSEAALTPIEIAEEKEPAPSSGRWFNDSTEFALLVNYTQQAILRDTQNQGKSRGVGYLNLEIKQDLWPGGAVFMEVESDHGRGIDRFIPTYSVFNDNWGERIDIYLPELYMEQVLFQDKVSVAAGKLDLSCWFDGNIAAESADTQFLSSALVNNLTIPFPAKGLGALADLQPCEWLYFGAGAATARASSTKTGLSDGFNSAFFITELGLSPKIAGLKGNYRFIFHADHEKLKRLDGEGEKKDTFGYGVSFDQEITGHITLFLRYGRADETVYDIGHFWSFGAQLFEPIPGRKLDCLGIGVARSIMGEDYRSANEEENASRAETMYEVYYSYNLNELVALTPSLQVVTNPNADKTAKTAIVLGLRFLLSF